VTVLLADRIAPQVNALRLLPMLLSVLMAPFFALGWSVARLWLAFRWVIAAFVVGFKVGMGIEPEVKARAG
jgi:hypothetical protein